MDEDATAAAESARVRAEIGQLPHSRRCPYCEVITQGGNRGLGQHIRKIHPGSSYAAT